MLRRNRPSPRLSHEHSRALQHGGVWDLGLEVGGEMYGDVLLTLIYDEVERAFGTTREALKSGR